MEGMGLVGWYWGFFGGPGKGLGLGCGMEGWFLGGGGGRRDGKEGCVWTMPIGGVLGTREGWLGLCSVVCIAASLLSFDVRLVVALYFFLFSFVQTPSLYLLFIRLAATRKKNELIMEKRMRILALGSALHWHVIFGEDCWILKLQDFCIQGCETCGLNL